MRLAVVPSLLAAVLLITACSNEQSVKGSSWRCSTSHPGGFVSNDIFTFSEKDTMTLDSDGMTIHGRYTQDGTTLTILLFDVPIPNPSGRMATQQQTLTANIRKKSANELEMDVSTGKISHLSSCRRN